MHARVHMGNNLLYQPGSHPEAGSAVHVDDRLLFLCLSGTKQQLILGLSILGTFGRGPLFSMETAQMVRCSVAPVD